MTEAVSTSSEKKWDGRDTADSKTQDKVKDLKNTLEKQVQKNDDQREKISSTAIILGVVSAMIVVVIVVVSLVLCLRHKKRLVEPDVRNEHKEMGHAVSAERDITDLAKPSSPSVSRARLESAAHMYRLDVGNIQLDDNPEHATSADRTLKTSYFKSLYDMARVPEDCVEFLQSVGIAHEMIFGVFATLTIALTTILASTSGEATDFAARSKPRHSGENVAGVLPESKCDVIYHTSLVAMHSETEPYDSRI